ncbi:MAG: hypothetical protein AAGG38_10680 [Planctomycetota bacterium]
MPPPSNHDLPSRHEPRTGHALVPRLLTRLFRDRGCDRPDGQADPASAVADLPAELADLVLTTVRRTRLWRREQASVAHELAAHFRDALGADPAADTDTLAQDFGDPMNTARLIRRAKRRNRPLYQKALIWAGRVVALLILLYALLALRFYLGSPNISVDYLAALNAPALAVPAEDRAWPIYREAWTDTGLADIETLDPLFLPDHANYVRPDQPGGNEAVAFLRRHAPLLRAARAAADKPGFGLAVSFEGDWDERDARALWGQDWAEHAAASQDDRPESATQATTQNSLLGVLLPQLGRMRTTARILGADTVHAAHQRDADRVLANLAALRSLAHHSAETPVVISGLVGISILALHHGLIQDLLREYPDLLTDEQWRTLARHTADVSLRGLVRFDGERMFMYDILQRAYTDNGRGDGRITDEGFEVLRPVHSLSMPMQDDRLTHWAYDTGVKTVVMPASLLLVASRRETRKLYDGLMDRMEADFDRSMRDSPGLITEQTLEDWSLTQRIRHPLIATLMPALGAIRRTTELAKAQQEGIILGIALERYRRAHGDWPADLADLTPQFLPELPVDRITGESLRYQPPGPGQNLPTVYSLGGDRDDDQGTPPLNPHTAEPDSHIAAYWIADADDDRKDDGDWIIYPISDW